MIQEPRPSGAVANRLGDLLRQAYGAQAAQLVHLAAKLSLADRLKDGRATTADLAATTGSDAALLRRVLQALVSLGVLD